MKRIPKKLVYAFLLWWAFFKNVATWLVYLTTARGSKANLWASRKHEEYLDQMEYWEKKIDGKEDR